MLWVDPGEVTGLARYEVHRRGFAAAEYPAEQAWDAIEAMAIGWPRVLAIGWERYTILPGTHKLTAQPAALETIGVCKFLARKYHCQVLPAAQQHTPDAVDQERLRRLGWWAPGKDDAQSAAYHMLGWLLRTGELPPREREILGI